MVSNPKAIRLLFTLKRINASMSVTRYKIHDTNYPYFLTCGIVNEYSIFTNSLAANTVLEAFKFLQDSRETTLFAYVIMENHIHFIAQARQLSKHIRSFKSWTAREIVDQFTKNGHTKQLSKLKKAKHPRHTNSRYQVWKEGYFPKVIYSEEVMLQKVEYIHFNPVKRGYVDYPEHWRYSSARNYAGKKGLIPVTLIEK